MTSLDSTVQPKTGSFQAVSILACAMTFYLYEYILRVSPSVMTDGLMRDFGVTSTALGVLASFYYYAYVPLQVPCGVIVDWFGPRRVITISALFCSIGAFTFSQSDSLFLAQIGRFLMGAGSACAYLSCMKVGSVWFSADKFAVISGIAMMMGTLGGTFGGRPFAILVNAYGWHEAMMIASIAGMAVTVAAWMIIRDYPKGYVCPHAHNAEVGLLDGLKVVASNPQNWLIGLYGLMMYLPLSAFAELWAVPYLMQRYGVTNEVAASASVMLFIGMAVGSPLGAWLSEKIQSRLKVMSWSALSTAAMFLAILYLPNVRFETMYVLQFLTGLLCGGQILYFAAAKEINPPQTSGTTIGFTNGLLMTSGVIFQPALGLILDLVWDGQYKVDGTPLYSLQNYQTALTVVALGLLVAWGILKFVYETHPSAKNKSG
ncbi:MAG: MFS transporter [Proteobacteria bacterium]|nr:MFS transporter [Pseudomonadota bacterium]